MTGDFFSQCLFALNPGLKDYIYRNNHLFTALQSNYGAKVRAIGTLAVTPPLHPPTPPAPALPPPPEHIITVHPRHNTASFLPGGDVQNVI